MLNNSTYNIHNTILGYQSEIERLKAQALMGWDKEFRNLKWYGLESGMSVIELGSGPGYFTQQLINHLPDSQITALEIDITLMDQAKNMLNHIPETRVQFVHSSIYETGLPDQSFDFAITRLLFLHLHNPLEAAKEIFRILKPGGKLVIIDIDEGIFGAINPDVLTLPSVLRKIAKHQAARGGNRNIGRSLPRLLKNSGYIDIDMDAVIQHSDLLGMEGFKRQFDIERFVGLFNSGIINQEEFDELKSASEKLSNSPDAYAMLTFVMACGKKPDLDW